MESGLVVSALYRSQCLPNKALFMLNTFVKVLQ